MIEVNIQKVIQYPFETVLGQYFDYEHIEFVHPHSLGNYYLLEDNGDTIIYKHVWPKKGLINKISIVEHQYFPPNEMWFIFTKGRYKGVKVHTRLFAKQEYTLVEETYYTPWPNWKWLKNLVERYTRLEVEKIWREDLDVEVCHGGWPGIPESYWKHKEDGQIPKNLQHF